MYFTVEKIKKYVEEIKKHIYEKIIDLEIMEYINIGVNNLGLDYVKNKTWKEFNIGNRWGNKDEIYWFRKTIKFPNDWSKDNVALYFNLGKGDLGGLSGTESLIYINEKPVQGLDINHSEVFLKPEWIINEKIIIHIKAFSGINNKNNLFSEAKLVKINRVTEDFYFRSLTVLQTVLELDKNSFDRKNLIEFLDKSFKVIDFRKTGTKEFYDSITKANELLEEFLKNYKSNEKNKPKVVAIGHSHIDVAWLWRLKHTREKASRTFSTVNHLMNQYEEYQFVQSQPQLYDYIKKDYPEIYENIKKRIKEGKWEVTGGMWVEADCNVPSGESLVRQFLFGQKFMKEEFDIRSKILWLPDVFGYSWALPQIIKKSGCEYFMTTKISWSQFNKPEYDTFNWRGIDGTEILTHFITTPDEHGAHFYTYNGLLTPKSVKGLWDNYSQKDINDELLIAFGWGDGGGGPTKEMIETGKKIKEMPSIPDIEFGKAEPFFKRLDERVKEKYKLPTVDGELYLEFHRGTYTSQGKTKRNNRKSEILLHNVEVFNTLSSIELNNIYPQEKINEGWKILLRNQFHDILPGSSIHEVYEDSQMEFEKLFNLEETLLNKVLQEISDNINIKGNKLIVFNSLSWIRSGEIFIKFNDEFKNKVFVDENNEIAYSKIIGNIIKINVENIPAMGYKTYKIVDGKNESIKNYLKYENDTIENKFYIIKLNKNGQIISLFDKEAYREVLPKGKKANVLQTFEDRPMMFDAWDIDIYYREKVYEINNLVNKKVIENGPDRIVINFEYEFLNSKLSQNMIVYSDKRRIDFETKVNWNEHQVLLKALFPVDVRTTKATYEIQFGNVERNTHWNTSWDYAKFETVAQKWVDLSERNYGVSLLNDCKYGHDIKDNNMRITLIKSGIEPDKMADNGNHEFVYSIMPHVGDWFDANTTKEAFELNYPLIAKTTNKSGNLTSIKSFIEVEETSVILDTVKKSEDENAFILRFYEYSNANDTVKVKLNSNIKILEECNLLEEKEKNVEFNKNIFEFTIKPFEIKTFKVYLEKV
ncbi:alpha-mannosidase [Tepiditoga spiralis]|uniref:Alpha-mannosidase n=1 Tax=Tepiditoga spiralis TaxID=2108365 RepID=A0A7G1G945_9BACT|nr:alpha-mannosidase [Tepiditoga spiralis]BBE31497.1 alpha-mannosidase [Tepiditoga spiralis]